jgi:TonB family protein
MFLCMVLVWSPPSGAEIPKEIQDNREAQPKVARAAAQRSEPVEPMRIGGEVSAPKLVSRPKIRWSDDPTQCYQLGVAVFEGVVDKNGSVKELRLIKGPDNEFTRAAREAMAQRKFEPAIYRGQPVDVTYHVTINHVPIKKVKGPC